MTTLQDLENEGRIIIEARKREVEEAQRVAAQEEAESKARMFCAVLKCLADHSGVDESELQPLLCLDREYKSGSFAARLTIPGVDENVATIHFYVSARYVSMSKVPNSDIDLDVQMERPDAPFCFTWRNPTYYPTLGEALAVAREKQKQADEYARISDEEDRLATERYQEHQRKEQEEKDDRVALLASLLDEHPILESLLNVLVAYLYHDADLQGELDSALEF